MCSNGALDGGFDFGLRAGRDACTVSVNILWGAEVDKLLLEHLGKFAGGLWPRKLVAWDEDGRIVLAMQMWRMPRDLVAVIDLKCGFMEG